VAVDAAGGENGCGPAVHAALEAAGGCDVLLVGPPDEIESCLDGPLPPSMTVIPASDTVRMDDDPITVVRAKRSSSLMRAARAVATGQADVMVTSGNTGAAVVAATVHFGRIPGISHPALAALLPSPLGGRPTVLVDVGAAATCHPEWLVQFAELGVAYSRLRVGTPRPTVALLSNGSESGKGGPTTVAAASLLSQRVDYVGQVEGHDLLTTDADVIVTDGFTGNVALKTFEGVAMVTARTLLEASRGTGAVTDADRQSWRRSLAEALHMDGGGVLLGLRHTCVIGHGASTAKDIRGAIELAVTCWQESLVGVMDEVASPPVLPMKGPLRSIPT
jgi:glycerol-3-phosphate acyltransferase PlsX